MDRSIETLVLSEFCPCRDWEHWSWDLSASWGQMYMMSKQWRGERCTFLILLSEGLENG